MTEAELTRQFADVMARYAVPQLAPDEWTTQMFADSQGISYNKADSIIKRAVKDRAVVSVGERNLSNGHNSEAYRYVSNPIPAA